MPHKYPTHPDYARIPVFNFRFNRLMVALMNAFVALSRWRVARQSPEGLAVSRVAIFGTGGRQIPGILYRPESVSGAVPLLLYFHGGAFALTYAANHLTMCQSYALRSGCAVLLVDYRLAPAHPWPAPFDDCYDSLLWARQSAQELAIDPRRIVVGGDSAGGALAAGVAQKALDQGEVLSGQMLVYPVTDSRCNTQSVQEFDDAPLWNSISTRRMWQAYLPGGDHQQPPEYAAPGLRQDLGGLPPAYVETAEFDPLRDEGEHYARALQAAGVPVEMNATQGTIHGYELAAENPIVKDAMDRRCAFLSACFQRPDSIDSTSSEA